MYSPHCTLVLYTKVMNYAANPYFANLNDGIQTSQALVFKSNISSLNTIILDSGKSHFECTASVYVMTY